MATAQVLDGLRSLLSHLDPANVYSIYSGPIDFFIFTLIFVGLAQATLAKHYEGRSGRAVAVGVGLALAVSAVLMEERFGVSIRFLGPVAAGVVALAIAVMGYRFLVFAGMGAVRAAAVTYILVFLAIQAVTPAFLPWLGVKAPLIGVASTVALLLAMVIAVSGLAGQGTRRQPDLIVGGSSDGGRQSRWKDRVQADPPSRRENAAATRQMARDVKALRKAFHDLSKDLVRRSRGRETRGALVQTMRRIMASANAVWQQVEDLKRRHDHVIRYDEALLREDLNEKLLAMNPEKRKALKRRVRQELAKVRAEKHHRKLEEQAREQLAAIVTSVGAAEKWLREGKPKRARQVLAAALRAERKLQSVARHLNRLEHRLRALTEQTGAAEEPSTTPELPRPR